MTGTNVIREHRLVRGPGDDEGIEPKEVILTKYDFDISRTCVPLTFQPAAASAVALLSMHLAAPRRRRLMPGPSFAVGGELSVSLVPTNDHWRKQTIISRGINRFCFIVDHDLHTRSNDTQADTAVEIGNKMIGLPNMA